MKLTRLELENFRCFEHAGMNPVPPEHAGRTQEVAKAWVRWARQSGRLP